MRRKEREKEYKKKVRPDYDCCVCIHREGCDRAAEGTFCTMFQSVKPVPEGEDLLARWERGEEVDF